MVGDVAWCIALAPQQGFGQCQGLNVEPLVQHFQRDVARYPVRHPRDERDIPIAVRPVVAAGTRAEQHGSHCFRPRPERLFRHTADLSLCHRFVHGPNLHGFATGFNRTTAWTCHRDLRSIHRFKTVLFIAASPRPRSWVIVRVIDAQQNATVCFQLSRSREMSLLTVLYPAKQTFFIVTKILHL